MKLPPVAVLLACTSCAVFAADPAFDRFADRVSDDWMRLNPQAATAEQYFSGAEQDAIDRKLTPISAEHRAAKLATARRALAELRAFDRMKLDPTQRISAATLEWLLDDATRSAAFEDYDFVFQQFRGLQVRLVNFLSQTHPIRNRRDIENYLARLEQVAPLMDDGIAQAADRAKRGILPPKFILHSTIQQFDRFLAGTPRENVLVDSLDERAAKVGGISAADRATFVGAAEKIVGTAIMPAFQRAQALLREQLPLANEDAGVWRFLEGKQIYAHALRKLTTTNFTAAQIHELGLKEVARIEREMDTLLRQLGYREGSIKERMEKLELSLQPPVDPDPRPGLIARYEEILADAQKRSELLFDIRPRAPVIVKREPPFTEKTAAAHYTVPAKDGSRPGIFWAPLPGPVFEITSMRTLVYHETIPGHHFQVALQRESETLPRFRRDDVFGFISANGEGWALYAEHLAAEQNWYEGDIPGRLGQLDDELFRARRLVVDTGLHAMRWTRQQAIDYGIKPSEVERYVVWPGQACSYKVGMIKILELRAKAQHALREKFSLKDFHNAVLLAGNVPLAVLELVIDDYIERARQR